ncbi:unnamed protein product [Ilex paraguariensis]|uniref:Uncharacterized protein n=1 Tax=Ilex paraguariensis TaxID=185542 RepID=A0ABC8UGM5_9AQUA
MEAVLLRSSPDQLISPNKQQHMRNSRRNSPPFISRPSNFQRGLLLPPPPSLSYSFPPPASLSNHPPQQQPPLLPLPISRPPHKGNNHRSRGLSCPPVNRKTNNRSRDHSHIPKKSKQFTASPKKEDPFKSMKMRTTVLSDCLIVASTNRLGPDPKDLPQAVSRVFSFSSSSSASSTNNTDAAALTATEQLDNKFSGSVVLTVSPPPSCLPLPTFSLRPKLSCSVEATGIDAGATNSLRRLLRLQ